MNRTVDKKSLNLSFCLLLFIISFAIRLPLVDTLYQYSFEPDSEACIEETKSFYFFFKNPCEENYPHTLTSYPNYSDGDFIVSALVANVVRPLCKSGIIKAPLADGDNSLIIFSMRWSGVLFDAGAMILAFMTLVLVMGNSLLSFAICLLYYLLNPQTLHINLIRIDHYSLFAANLMMWAALSLFHSPARKRYYIWCGVAAGLVSATKINFPFYLLILIITFGFLVFRRKVTIRHFALFIFAFLLCFSFVYLRWLMYTENVLGTLKATFDNGEEWFNYWGNKNYFYYLWTQFYTQGFSYSVLFFLLFFYSSVVYSIVLCLKQKSSLMCILCITFLIQSVSLMISPKVARYAIIMPLWVSLFVGIGLSTVIKQFPKRIIHIAFTLLLLGPIATYSMKNYFVRINMAEERNVSVIETRIKPYEWIKEHIKKGSVIAIQHPRVSNPPIFDLPLYFRFTYLQFPFLDKRALADFHPPSFQELRKHVHYLMISDKERDYHLQSLHDYRCDSPLIESWQRFFDTLPQVFPYHRFSSVYANYGVKSIYLFEVNDTLPVKGITGFLAFDSVKNGKVVFYWVYGRDVNSEISKFQIQISEDSLFRWLELGSRDGYPSRYRLPRNPELISGRQISFVPDVINRGFEDGRFYEILNGKNPIPMKKEIENFFRKVLSTMLESNLTFEESIWKTIKPKEAPIFLKIVASLYPNGEEILHAHILEYIRLTGLKLELDDLRGKQAISLYRFYPTFVFDKDKHYYWRVRLKFKEKVLSEWSNTRRL
jgi:hypothetical protein